MNYYFRANSWFMVGLVDCRQSLRVPMRGATQPREDFFS